ncbi:uncharacterized protein K460DRAFT_371300 [Cucurbitaria berberidis CBS 394.84]|uniref:Uncharacterized protein n=1 Tax=Cucurbitaria berberidis CBS 394.84 TaxID=1168544 RepID=A0A9P4L383_9PLEO|nr:uncharacterized protein K460DRAFT_371300 [Cucurbitaria berberidis CBS 394.84]KAF1840080.1 hypothetical protein K460DRAFT_371300 [Cucurbitaria berberidis CBS 394.84]
MQLFVRLPAFFRFCFTTLPASKCRRCYIRSYWTANVLPTIPVNKQVPRCGYATTAMGLSTGCCLSIARCGQVHLGPLRTELHKRRYRKVKIPCPSDGETAASPFSHHGQDHGSQHLPEYTFSVGLRHVALFREARIVNDVERITALDTQLSLKLLRLRTSQVCL